MAGMLGKIGQLCGNLCNRGADEGHAMENMGSKSSRAENFAKVAKNTAHIDEPSRPLAVFLNSPMGQASGGSMVAIDLGAGGGRDTRALAARGWQVHAIDPTPEACATIQESAAKLGTDKIKVHQGTILDPALELSAASVDLVNVQRTLPLIPAQELPVTLAKIAEVLRPGGYLCASFFGPNHDWAKDVEKKKDHFFHSQKEVQKLIEDAGLSLRTITPVLGPIETAVGKHVENWHQINVLAQKPRKSLEGRAIEQQLRQQMRQSEDSIRIETVAGPSSGG